MVKPSVILVFLWVLLSTTGTCGVSMPKIFSNHMVLQRDQPITLWGWGDPLELISIHLGPLMEQVKVGKNGKWTLDLAPMSAGGPYVLIVKGRESELIFENILIGDLWICSGQSNMEWTNDQFHYQETDTTFLKTNIRLFKVSIDMDYLPQEDLKGGTWQLLDAETMGNFSAVSYYFGKNLSSEIDVPIGLINVSLGSSSIEAWMSNDALVKFPQFKEEVNTIVSNNKSFEELRIDFEKGKEKWSKKHYLKDIGLDLKWFAKKLDDSDWLEMKVSGFWEELDTTLVDHDGAVWFRKTFDLPEGYDRPRFSIQLNQIDDYDVVWVNGKKIGETYGRHNFRNYSVETNLLQPKDNVIAVRVFDIGGNGGFSTSAFWGNPIIWGDWKYKKGTAIDVDNFKAPLTVNASPFSSPGVLYNGNIAPLTKLKIKGIFWYQGESNVDRAHEYQSLFPEMIVDWRGHFGDVELPFLYVQLPNYLREASEPVDQSWSEMRMAQDQALKLLHVGRVVTIDIGDADDIHPKNKVEVGRRSAIVALNLTYGRHFILSPIYKNHRVEDHRIFVSIDQAVEDLVVRDKYGYIRGFAIAGADQKFYWAKATISNGEIEVFCEEVEKPVAIRYAWSSNPGTLNLFNKEGWPLAPFQTDNWKGITEGNRYHSKDARF